MTALTRSLICLSLLLPVAWAQIAVPPMGAETPVNPSEPAPEIAIYRQFLDLNLKLGNTADAEQNARALLARDPKDAQALGAMVSIHTKQKNNKAALATAATLRAHHPGTESDLAMVGALRLNRRFEESLAILNKLKTNTPAGQVFPHLIEFGYTYYDARDISVARQYFERVRNDHRYLPNQRAEAGKQLAAMQRDAKLVSAYTAIEQRDFDQARTILGELNNLAANSPKPATDLVALEAILDADQFGKVEEAARTFATIKKKTPAGEVFPYGSSFATQLIDMRRYAEAEAEIRASADPKSFHLTPEDIASHDEALRYINVFTRPHLTVAERLEDRAEGQAYRTDFDASLPLHGGLTRLGIDAAYHHLDIPGPGDRRYGTMFVTAKRQLSRHLHASAALGHVAGDFAWRAGLGWTRPSQDTRFEIQLASGQRPTDTLRLESLGAQEDRLTAGASFELPHHRRFRLKADAFARRVDLDSMGIGSLGDGWGARVELEYLLYLHKKARVTASYFVAIEEFDFKSSLARPAAINPRDLLEESFQSTGFMILAQAPLSDKLNAQGRFGLDYRFETDELVYIFGGGLDYRLNESTRLEIEAAYYSSGTAGNAAAGYFEGRIGLDITL